METLEQGVSFRVAPGCCVQPWCEGDGFRNGSQHILWKILLAFREINERDDSGNGEEVESRSVGMYPEILITFTLN